MVTKFPTGIRLPGAGLPPEATQFILNPIHGVSRGGDPAIWGSSKQTVGEIATGAKAGLAGRFVGDVKIEGTLNVTEDIFIKNADCAEDFDIALSSKSEPGSVMVLDIDGNLCECNMAYDKRVVGVVSGAGKYRPGLVLDRHPDTLHRKPIALMGKVFCKVDCAYGEISVGDLLTTSPTLGHAMRVQDANQAFGTVIGKALSGAKNLKDLIPVLIALQ